MKQRLNIKLLAGLSIGTTLFCFVVYFLHDYQVRRNADGLLVRAEEARNGGDLEEAIRIMRRYLAHRPEDVKQYKPLAIDSKEMIFKAAQAGERVNRKDLGLALSLMEQAVREAGNDLELRRVAADFWFQLGQFDDAVEHLKYVQESGQATIDDEMKYIECLRQMGKVAEAVELLDEMVGYDPDTKGYSVEKAAHPDNLQAYRTLALIHLNSRLDKDQAEAVIHQMVAANPKDHEAYLSRARFMPSMGRDDSQKQAKADIERAVELAPEETDVLIAKANMLKNDKQFDEARKLVKLGLAKETDNREFGQLHKLLAEIAIREGDIDLAFQVLDEGLAKLPKHADLLWTKAQLHVDRKEFDELQDLRGQLHAAHVPEPMFAYLDSRVLIHEQKFLEASKMLAKIRPLVDARLQYQVNVYLNQCYTVLRRPDAQLATLQRILEVTPGLQSAQLSYAEILIKQGRNEEALRRLMALQSKLQQDGEPISPRLSTLIVDIKMRNMEAVPEDERDWSELEKIVSNLWQRDDVESINKIVLVIQLFVKEGKIDKAISWTERGINENPDNFAFWTLRLDLARDKAEADEVFARIEQRFDDRVPLRISRAKLAIKYDPDKAPDVIKQQEDNADVFEAPLRAQLYRDLATLHLVLRNRKEAERLLELAHQTSPARVDILTTLYEIASLDTDQEKLRDIVDRIESITTRNDETWKMAEAGRIVWMVRNKLREPSYLAQAKSLVERVRQDRPGWVPVLLLEADIHRLSNDTDLAIQSLENAHRLQPSNTSIVRRLAQMYNDTGRIAKAQEMMEKLPFSQRSEHDLRNRLKLLILQRDFAAATKLADAVIPESSENVIDQIWRSQIFLSGGNLDIAERAARRALELERGLAEVWTNLIKILALQDKQIEAAAVMQEADLYLPEQIKPLVLGQCYALLGDANMAQNQYHHALKNDPDNILVKQLLCELLMAHNQIAASRKLLLEILDIADAEQHAKEIQWARRKLAMVLAGTRRYTDFRKALETIELNAVDGELSREDLALWISLSTQRPDSESWRGAINRLEQIETQRGLNDNEMFMKAQLYERYDERWPEVTDIVLDLLTRNSGNTKMLERWVGWLFKRGDLRQAETWKRNLPKNSVLRIRVESHALAKVGNHRQAVQKLDALVPQQLDDLQAYGLLVMIAEIAEELGPYDKVYYQFAENQLRKLAQKEPKQMLRLATVMGLHRDADGDGKIDPRDVAKIQDALRMCMAVKQNGISLGYGASVALTILREHPRLWETSLKSSIDQLERWLDQELTANPQDFALKARVAEFHDLMGHLDRVEREYREILVRAERMNPLELGMILNNLAYVMALNGETQEPLELLQQAIDLLGPTADLIDTRGYIRLVRGESAEAVADFHLAINDGTKTGHKLFHLALALEENGDSEQSANFWREAIDLGLNEYKLPYALRDEFRQLQAKYPPKTTYPAP